MLVLKGIYQYWTYFILPRGPGLKQMEGLGVESGWRPELPDSPAKGGKRPGGQGDFTNGQPNDRLERFNTERTQQGPEKKGRRMSAPTASRGVGVAMRASCMLTCNPPPAFTKPERDCCDT